jgi:hypothetical protein
VRRVGGADGIDEASDIGIHHIVLVGAQAIGHMVFLSGSSQAI